MKIVIEHDEMAEMVEELVKEKYKALIGENNMITTIKNLGSGYGSVEIIIEPREAKVTNNV